MKHLKRFNENTKIDYPSLSNYFAEFIDNGAYVESDEDYFEIFMSIQEPQYRKNKTISDYISEYEIPLDILKDVEVAIKRVYDKFGIYPKIEEVNKENIRYIRLSYDGSFGVKSSGSTNSLYDQRGRRIIMAHD